MQASTHVYSSQFLRNPEKPSPILPSCEDYISAIWAGVSLCLCPAAPNLASHAPNICIPYPNVRRASELETLIASVPD